MCAWWPPMRRKPVAIIRVSSPYASRLEWGFPLVPSLRARRPGGVCPPAEKHVNERPRTHFAPFPDADTTWNTHACLVPSLFGVFLQKGPHVSVFPVILGMEPARHGTSPLGGVFFPHWDSGAGVHSFWDRGTSVPYLVVFQTRGRISSGMSMGLPCPFAAFRHDCGISMPLLSAFVFGLPPQRLK